MAWIHYGLDLGFALIFAKLPAKGVHMDNLAFVKLALVQCSIDLLLN